MINQRYCSEIESLLIQFVSAFDDCRILRANKKGGEFKEILPRWVVAPKTRVFTDIINKAGNITLPVAVVNVKSINLRQKDLFNKQLNQTRYYDGKLFSYAQPVPVDIKVSVHFYTKFIGDLWQLMANFASFTKPYIFISWRTPTDSSMVEELRSKVTWEGGFSVNVPESFTEDKEWILEGSSDFTIEGWLFETMSGPSNIITSVQDHNYASSTVISMANEEGEIDYVWKDGWPSVTNIINPENIYLSDKLGEILPVSNGTKLIIEGRSFFDNRNTGAMFIPVNGESLQGFNEVTIDTIKMGEVSGYSLPFTIIDENHLSINIPDNMPIGLNYDIIFYNKAGYTTLEQEKNITFKATTLK